jgi:fibrillarin-like pre-rRNA processing protein
MKKFLKVCETRKNIIPIFQDANHPERYLSIVPIVDFIYQDVSQRNQADIFIRNSNMFLKEKSKGIIMVKARSIDVSIKPKKAYELVCKNLKESGFLIEKIIDLSPFEKDHAAIVVTK